MKGYDKFFVLYQMGCDVRKPVFGEIKTSLLSYRE